MLRQGDVFLICNLMSLKMFCEVMFPFESFLALVALKWPLTSVFPIVFLQITRCRAGVVTLITLEQLFSCMHPHHVIFQLTSLNEGRLT